MTKMLVETFETNSNANCSNNSKIVLSARTQGAFMSTENRPQFQFPTSSVVRSKYSPRFNFPRLVFKNAICKHGSKASFSCAPGVSNPGFSRFLGPNVYVLCGKLLVKPLEM